MVGAAEGDDRAGELDAERGGGLWWEGVGAFALEEVHAVEAEGFDFDEGLGGAWLRDRGVVVHEQGGDGAFAAFDVDGTHLGGVLGGHGGGGVVGWWGGVVLGEMLGDVVESAGGLGWSQCRWRRSW